MAVCDKIWFESRSINVWWPLDTLIRVFECRLVSFPFGKLSDEMAEGFTLLDVSVEPTRGVNDIIKEAFEAIKSGLKKSDTKLIHAFKVTTNKRGFTRAESLALVTIPFCTNFFLWPHSQRMCTWRRSQRASRSATRWSVHTALGHKIKGFRSKFFCKSAFASHVNCTLDDVVFSCRLLEKTALSLVRESQRILEQFLNSGIWRKRHPKWCSVWSRVSGLPFLIETWFRVVLNFLYTVLDAQAEAYQYSGFFFVTVAQGDPDHALHEMNERHGEKLRVVSTPLRSYFSFAEKVTFCLNFDGRVVLSAHIRQIYFGIVIITLLCTVNGCWFSDPGRQERAASHGNQRSVTRWKHLLSARRGDLWR